MKDRCEEAMQKCSTLPALIKQVREIMPDTLLNFIGPGIPSCAAACAALTYKNHVEKRCDDNLLMRLNRFDAADIGSLFKLANVNLQQMLDIIAKRCIGGHRGFNDAMPYSPGRWTRIFASTSTLII